jgi:cytochrome c peroxidase
MLRPSILLLALLSFFSCEEAQHPGKGEKPKVAVRFGALPNTLSTPAGNPMTDAKVELGRLLFFDPILSGDQDVACATCHHPSSGWAEFRDISIGVNGQGLGSKRSFKSPNTIPFVKRNAHTILNTAFNGMDAYGRYDPATSPMFWDSRVASLEKQALEPILAHEEMRGENFSEDGILEKVIKRVAEIPEYQEKFAAAFGAEVVTGDGEGLVSSANLARAIAAFERSLITINSRFDQFMRGDREALSLAEQDGFAQFKKAGCGNCHNGPMFSDFKRHVLGVPENGLLPEADGGPEADFAFRTPSLRNLRFTAPYMHNGTFPDLLKVLEFYEDIASGKERNPHVSKANYDPLVREIDLRVKGMRPIISFLNALNDDDFDQSVPERVPSGLPVGGDIH